MFKQIFTILVLSVIVVMTMEYMQQGLQLLLTGYNWISELLTQVFSGGEAGNLIRQLISLLVIPVAVALIPVSLYWLAKRAWFPYFMQLVWIVWLVQTAALIITYKITT